MLRLVCLVVLSLASAVAAFAADPPRYRLPVGRVLYYSGEGSSKEKDANAPASTSRQTWRCTVLAQNADGSARVLSRSTFRYNRHGAPADEDVHTAVFDLYPDGRYRIDPELAIMTSPEQIFPRLPADAAQAAKQWQSDAIWTGNRTTFVPQSTGAAGANEFVFTGVQDGPVNRIYLLTFKYTFHFDPAKGLVTRITGEHSQDYGFHSRGTSTITFDKEESIPADQAAALDRDYATFADAVKRYREAVRSLHEQPEKAKEHRDAARAALAADAEKVHAPEVKQAFEKQLKEIDQYATDAIDDAKRLANRLNKPAPDWSAKDLAGQPVSAQALRGKVIVLDFWYRGCGWCMYAMPQVNQLAADFKDRAVVVLGMNTDRNLDDANFVVKELGLTYQQVQATGIPEKFEVQGFPTLLIIDQQGRLQHVHVGYSPNMRAELSKKIEALLKPDQHP